MALTFEMMANRVERGHHPKVALGRNRARPFDA
jgi:hypothetical protein